jgi:hypothetical protein
MEVSIAMGVALYRWITLFIHGVLPWVYLHNGMTGGDDAGPSTTGAGFRWPIHMGILKKES